jgi:hypothetical protein
MKINLNGAEILNQIKDCIIRCDFNGLAKNVEDLVQVTDDNSASLALSKRLYNRFNFYKSGAIAKMLETIIRIRPELAMVKYPENYFFRMAVSCGSIDIYECYIEEAIIPYLVGKTEDEVVECYLDLYLKALKLTEASFPEYVQCLKGRDFNGAFSRYEKDEAIALIHQEDYEIMHDIVEKYNTIIGQRDILNDLNKRAGMEE